MSSIFYILFKKILLSPFFKFHHAFFSYNTTGGGEVAAGAVGFDDPMTGNDQRQWIGRHDGSNGPGGFGVASQFS